MLKKQIFQPEPEIKSESRWSFPVEEQTKLKLSSMVEIFSPEQEIKGHIRSDSLDSIVKEANKPAIVIDA